VNKPLRGPFRFKCAVRMPATLPRLFHIVCMATLAPGFAQHGDATPPWLRGIDTSHYQGTIDWNAVRASNITFACTKATEGLSSVDPTFATNWAGMRAAGIVRCAYHYALLSESAIGQAKHFVSTVSAHGYRNNSKSLQFMLDLEDSKSGLGPSAIWQWVQDFMGEVEKLTGRPGIIYTSYYYWKDTVGNPKNNLNAPLWLAWYTSPLPKAVPAAWPSGWTFWQYDDNGAAYPGAPGGSVPGINGNVDVDYFKYSYDTLLKFCFP